MARGIKNVYGISKKSTYFFIFLFVVFCCLFTGCKSTTVLDNGGTTTEIRDGISELERQELESQRTEFEIKESGKEIEQTSDAIDGIINESAEHYNRIDRILQQIREQSIE